MKHIKTQDNMSTTKPTVFLWFLYYYYFWLKSFFFLSSWSRFCFTFVLVEADIEESSL